MQWILHNLVSFFLIYFSLNICPIEQFNVFPFLKYNLKLNKHPPKKRERMPKSTAILVIASYSIERILNLYKIYNFLEKHNIPTNKKSTNNKAIEATI